MAIEMFLIRLLHLKTKFSDSVTNLKNFENNQEKIEKVTKELQKKIEPVPSDNKTIDQLKFSTQKKEKLIIEDKPFKDKIKIESFSDLITTCIEKKEIGLKYELENNINLINFKNNNIEISFNDNLDKNFIKNLTSKLLDWTGERWIIMLSKKTGTKSMKEVKKKLQEDNINNFKNTEIFKNAVNKFQDLEIVNFKELEDLNND